MGALIDLSGRRLGFLTVIEQAGNRRCGGALWKCRCVCGAVVIVGSQNLRQGKARSCGCKRAAMRMTAFDRRRPEARRAVQPPKRWLTRQQAIQRVHAQTESVSRATARSTLHGLVERGLVRTKASDEPKPRGAKHPGELYHRADLVAWLRARTRSRPAEYDPVPERGEPGRERGPTQ